MKKGLVKLAGLSVAAAGILSTTGCIKPLSAHEMRLAEEKALGLGFMATGYANDNAGLAYIGRSIVDSANAQEHGDVNVYVNGRESDNIDDLITIKPGTKHYGVGPALPINRK